MRGIILATLVGLVAVGTASSSYVAYQNVMAGRVDLCGIGDHQVLPDADALFQRARLDGTPTRRQPAPR